MDWFSRVCVARNLAAARGAQTGRPGGVGTARRQNLTGHSSLTQGNSAGIRHTELTGDSMCGILVLVPSGSAFAGLTHSKATARGLGVRHRSSGGVCGFWRSVLSNAWKSERERSERRSGSRSIQSASLYPRSTACCSTAIALSEYT